MSSRIATSGTELCEQSGSLSGKGRGQAHLTCPGMYGGRRCGCTACGGAGCAVEKMPGLSRCWGPKAWGRRPPPDPTASHGDWSRARSIASPSKDRSGEPSQARVRGWLLELAKGGPGGSQGGFTGSVTPGVRIWHGSRRGSQGAIEMPQSHSLEKR